APAPGPAPAPTPDQVWGALYNWISSLEDTNGRPPVPTNPELSRNVSRAMAMACRNVYLAGGNSFRSPGDDITPTVPDDASSEHENCLWEYFWHGYCYMENRANGAIAAQTTAAPVVAPAPATPKAPKVSDPEYYHGDRAKYENYASQLAIKL